MCNSTRLKRDLQREEGVELSPYFDTVNKLTIGVGRNLDDVGITHDEAMYLFNNDVQRVVEDLEQIQAYRKLNAVRQEVLVCMAFNLGVPGLMRFRRMWAAIRNNDFGKAADEIKDSKAYRQLRRRYYRYSMMMRTGLYAEIR